MKRLLLAVLTSVVGLCLGSAPVSAAAVTGTQHINSLQDVLPFSCAGPGGAIQNVATGNGVMHFIANSTGDWFTATFSGQDALTEGANGGTFMNPVFVPNGGPTFQGHMEEWFGFEGNLNNTVAHATFNFHGANVVDSTQSLAIHAAFDMTFNANGILTVNNFTLSCS